MQEHLTSTLVCVNAHRLTTLLSAQVFHFCTLLTGFVGLFNVLILWPGLLLFHYTDWETFQLPNKTELILMLVNGLIGTVLSELLWLW